MFRGIAGLSCALLTAGPVLAEGWSVYPTLSGYVEYEYGRTDQGDEDVLAVDATFSLRPFRGVGGFGIDSTLLVLTDGDAGWALFAAGTWTAGSGKLSFGVPRPAYSDLVDLPDPGGNRRLGSEYPLDMGGAEYLYFLGDRGAPPGLRYDLTLDRLTVGTSLHRFPDDDLTVAGIAASYAFARGRLFGGVEYVRFPDDSATDAILGAERDFGGRLGTFSVGAAIFDRDAHLNQRGGQIWASYAPTERLEISGTGILIEDRNLYGLSAEYRYGGGNYLQGGLADGEQEETVMDLSFGLRF